MGDRAEPTPRLLEGDQVVSSSVEVDPLPPLPPSLESEVLVFPIASSSHDASEDQSAKVEAAAAAAAAGAAATPVDEAIGSLEAVGLSEDAGHDLRLDQATFFRSVEDGNVETLLALLKNRKVDINAYNDDGMTAVHLAVYKYEQSRNLSIVETLIKHGANVCVKAAGTPSTHRISIIRHDSKHSGVMETKKVDFHQKPALLVALELKSSLYLRGWEYRHWDDMLKLLAEAAVRHYTAKNVREPVVQQEAISAMIHRNWKHVFEDGKHELVEVWAEGKHVNALKLLLSGASKILKINIEKGGSSRIDIKDASFTIARAMVEFLYTGSVDSKLVEHRGIDMFMAAHKYGVDLLKAHCEVAIVPIPDNWIKLMSVATECNSDVLTWKCAASIARLMEMRRDSGHILRHSFSELLDGRS